MNLQQLRYFVAVFEHGGIGPASSALLVSQPTISQAVRQLERELGVELFHRIGRGMVPTSGGTILAGPAKRILRDVATAAATLPDLVGRLHGRLDIDVRASLAADLLPALVARYRQHHPGVSIRIDNAGDDETVVSRVRDGHCEIAITHVPFPDTAGLEVLELGVLEYWLVYPAGTELPPVDPLPLTMLPDIPFIVVPSSKSYVQEIAQAFQVAGQRRRPAVIIEHRGARLPLVVEGVGGTILERTRAESAAAKGLVAVATDPPIVRAFGLVFDPTAVSPAAQAFLEVANDYPRSVTSPSKATSKKP